MKISKALSGTGAKAVIRYKVKNMLSGRWGKKHDVYVYKVSNGVYYIYIYLKKRCSIECTGNADAEIFNQSIYFIDNKENIIEVSFKFPSEGFLFGEVSKDTYHGTFYEDAAYKKILD